MKQGLILAAAVGAAMALPVPASAHGGSPSIVHGCIKNGALTVRIVAPSAACASNETARHWNVTGVKGPAGPQGATGPRGPSGPVGAGGAQGPAGTDGADGGAGPIGPQGATGPAGPAGTDGTSGPQGETGAQGLKGDTGATGSQGLKGDTGATGPQGETGSAGAQGPQGISGATGAQGPQGEPGAAGAQGPAGPDGQSVTTSEIAEGDPRCPKGGVELQSASGENHVCNGDGGNVLGPIVTSEQMAQISAWAGLPDNFAWNLCYKGTRDSNNNGFFLNTGAAAFHAQCNNRGRSFFVAETAGGILFGGYTSLAWESTGSACTWRSDSEAFLFSLTNNFKHTQPGVNNDPNLAILDCHHLGPTFGAGYDFYTDLRFNAHTNIGYTYACRVGTYGSQQCRDDFAGAHQPALVELEVYTEN